MIIDDLGNHERYAALPRLHTALQTLERLSAEGIPAAPIDLGDEVGRVMLVHDAARRRAW